MPSVSIAPSAGGAAVVGAQAVSVGRTSEPGRIGQPLRSQLKCLDRRRARATRVRTGLEAELNGMTDMSQT
jgi:hypothetical protein